MAESLKPVSYSATRSISNLKGSGVPDDLGKGWNTVGAWIRGALMATALGFSSPALAQSAASPASSLADTAAGHLARGQTNEAINAYSAALGDNTLTNDRRATLLNDRGVAYARAGQVKLAVEDFNAAAGLFPEYAAIYNNRGNLLVSLGLLKEALKDLDRAILLAPGYTSAFNNRAGLYVRLGQQGDAIADYTRAVQLSPQMPAPLAGRGQVYLAMLRPHSAARDFTRALMADSRFVQGYLDRASAKLMIANYQEAIEDVSRAAAFDVSNPEIYVLRGEAYLALRDLPAALKDFTQAITLDPKNVGAYLGRGLTQARASAFDEAFADLNRAIELDPRSARAFAYRAFVYKQTGQVGVGQKDIETALKLDPKSGDVVWAKAEIEEAQGLLDQAIADAKLARAWRPGSKDAIELLQRIDTAAGSDRIDVAKAGEIDGWRVIRNGTQFEAINDALPRVAVPIEMFSEGLPKLSGWDVQAAPHENFGILKFAAGQLQTNRGADEIEMAALIDIPGQRVVTIVPNKRSGTDGSKSTSWSFEDRRITVASVDGLTEEFPLDAPANVGALAAGAAIGAAGTRRLSSGAPTGTAWAPWNDPIGMPRVNAPSSSKPIRTVQKKKKPKNIFELLFN
jgi:tetratricopeptide (TPR) repeat protein